jgi:hypothetical protein
VWRNASVEEQRERVPELAAATRRLAGAGWLTVHRASGAPFVPAAGPAVSGPELERAVADPAAWLAPPEGREHPHLRLRATAEGRRRWEARAYAPGAPPTIHELDLAEDEHRIRVCAMEASGWLTGPFGVLADLPAGLDGEELRTHVAAELAPLVRFVRAGMIEVLHVAEPDGESAVVPPADLLDAFSDRSLRCDDRDDWGVGFTCVLTQSPANALR